MLLKDFMQALLDEASLNPNSLANRMGKRSVQSLVERITEGRTLNPRLASIESIATFFNVPPASFFDASIAAEVAASRGWSSADSQVDGNDPASRRRAPIVNMPAPSTLSIQELARQMAERLAPFDASARKAAASLLSDLALHPEQGASTAAHLARLLGTQGNEPPLKSFRSQGNGN